MKDLCRESIAGDNGTRASRPPPAKVTVSAPLQTDRRAVQTVLTLQRSVGNAAVARLLADDGPHAPPWRPPGVRSAGLGHDFQSLDGEQPAAVEEGTLDQQVGAQQSDAAAVGAAAQRAPVPTVAAGPTVGFTTTVRGPSTPAAMARDRIPPNVDFPVAVTIAGWSLPMSPVVIAVAGSGGANGTATVDGAASALVIAGGTVTLRGIAQTTPGNAGKLRLTASLGGRELASSNVFSVAAIPQDMVLTSMTPLTGARRGFIVTQTWSSDSGSVADLDEVQVSELVQYISSIGCFSGLGVANSGYVGAAGGTLTDTHSTPVAALSSSGSRVASQTEMFLDRRTGVIDIPMRNSGFAISRLVVHLPDIRMITTSKVGAAGTAKGVASAAGAGSFTLSQPY
jgi:hypothetical protein